MAGENAQRFSPGRLCENPILLGVFALLLPVVCAVLAGLGMSMAEVEQDISRVWARAGSELQENFDYTEQVFEDAGATRSRTAMLISVSRPRAGGSHMTKAGLEELIVRMNTTELETTVTVDGVTYTWEDICSDTQEVYRMPCLRFGAVDAYVQGGYNWGEEENAAWYDFAVDALVKQRVINLMLGGPTDGTLSPFGHSCLMSCGAVWALGLGNIAAILDQLPKNEACSACMKQHEEKAYAGLVQYEQWQTDEKRDFLYWQTVNWMLPVVAAQPAFAPLFAGLPIPLETALQVLPQAQIQAQLVDPLIAFAFGLQKGVSNPYVWQLGNRLTPQGYPRPSIASDTTANTQLASGSIYWYDEGVALTQGFSRPLIIGTDYAALEVIWPMLEPHNIVKRVQNENRPGGPLQISKETAERVLKDFKARMEEVWSQGWDEDESVNQYLAFSDDVGAYGTVGKALLEITTNGLQLSFVSYAVIAAFTAAFLFNCDPVRSRLSLGIAGVLLAMLAVLAGFGLSALFGWKFNIVQMWTLPFLLVGIGVDDMYVITVAIRKSGETGPDSFARGMSSVLLPVTMTSFVNIGIFAIFQISDVPAVYLTGRTAMLSIGLLYLTMITAYPALLFLDHRRREQDRMDILCCKPVGMDRPDKEVEQSWAVERLYGRVIRNGVTRALVVLLSLVLLGISGYGVTLTEVGFDLDEFFDPDTQAGTCMKVRLDYFPVWPATVNWGVLEYRDPDVQLHMLKIWEGVVAQEHMTVLDSDLVWTARYALWGTDECLALGKVDQCGSHWQCEATWVPNSLGLKNISVPAEMGRGVCRSGAVIRALATSNSRVPMTGLMDDEEYCPAFVGQTEAQQQRCLAHWANFSGEFSVVSPGYPLEADDLTPIMPIRYSKSDGNVLFSIGLNTIDDYVTMIEDSRAVCDEDEVLNCWMYGLGYRYYEQFVTIWEFTALTTGTALGAGWLFSFFFLLFEFLCADAEASMVRRVAAALYGSAFIGLVMAASVLTTWGISSLAGTGLQVLSVMAYLMSLGYAVEYSVHVVHRFLVAPAEKAEPMERVGYAMEMLCVPTFMSFASSAIGIIFMAFSSIVFVRLYFFVPLISVVIDTYFYGCFLLPALLSFLACPCVYICEKEQPAGGAGAAAAAAAAGGKEGAREERAQEPDVDNPSYRV